VVGGHIDVFFVESGGLNFEDATQALYQGESVRRRIWLEWQLRMFGGSANHWTGRCVELDPVDFTVRERVPQSGCFGSDDRKLRRWARRPPRGYASSFHRTRLRYQATGCNNQPMIEMAGTFEASVIICAHNPAPTISAA
jgi:hypothetical protein